MKNLSYSVFSFGTRVSVEVDTAEVADVKVPHLDTMFSLFMLLMRSAAFAL